MASYEKHSFFNRHCGNPSDVIFPVSVPEYYFSPIKTDRKLTEKEDREDKKVRQFILFCRTALKYEKLNYYNKRKHRAERETHIDILTARQLGMSGRFFHTYHADYFSVMVYEMGI